jgi:hypothetical protein
MATHTLFLNIASFQEYPDEAHCISERDNCIVPRDLWQGWVNLDREVLLLEIKQGESRHVFVVEAHHDFSPNTVYIPSRFINDYKRFEIAEMKILSTIPPVASMIKLGILEEEYEGFDIVTAVSEYLSHWNVLTKGSIISVPCPELGGYPVEILVSETKPEDTVLLRGEVPLELEEREISPETQAHTTINPSTEFSSNADNIINNYFNELSEEILSDILPPQNVLVSNLKSDRHCKNKEKTNFTPFGGTGYRLGS